MALQITEVEIHCCLGGEGSAIGSDFFLGEIEFVGAASTGQNQQKQKR
jgi:hypothetical protein